jgi:excisionase family DNA binding protein
LEALLDPQAVADILGLSPATVRELARKNELPSVRLGYKTVRFRASDVEAFIERRAVRPGA